ncbi:MAG: type II secretion system secretin GspD [Ideonella sp.]|nr:type II secretion system secretin GspD [Ideonella sp.]
MPSTHLAPARHTLSLLLAGLVALAWPLNTPAAGKAAPKAAAQENSSQVTLNFVNADIEAVTRAIASMINRQMLVDPRVKGTITVYSERPLSSRDAYQNYLAALRGLGFSVVETGGLLKVVPEADAKLQTGVVSVGPFEPRGDQVITQVFKLSHENPNNLVAVLRPLISPNNTINANPGTSSLVITDYADNLTRIAKIIAALDQPSATDVEIVPLQHAVASDLAVLVQKLGDAAAPGGLVPGAAATATVMADPRGNALILRAPNPAKMASMRALIARLDQPGAQGPAGSIRVVYLKNADATKLATVLRAAFGGGGSGSGGSSPSTGFTVNAMSPQAGAGIGTTANSAVGSAAATTPVSASAQPSTGGFVQADPSTNSLIITAPDPLYRQIRSVIDQLDGRRAQVFVETMIVEMDATKAAEFGFQWQGLLGRKGDGAGLALGTNFGTGSSNIINLATAGTAITAGKEVNGLNLGLLQRVNGVYTLAALARFLETVSGTNILSTPNLMALDNEEAKIVVGSNVPFVTGSFTNTGSGSATLNPFQTIERKDVGLTLKIKPQIGEGGVVRMTVFQENSSVVANSTSNTNGPVTNKNSVETTVVAQDGQIMVLGGQTRDQFDGSGNKVPGLGDLPLFGNLFKNESRNRSRSVLLLFLRPVVIRDAQEAGAFSLDRYDAIRAQQKEAQPVPSLVMPINEAPVLPPMRAPVGANPAPAPLGVPKSGN